MIQSNQRCPNCGSDDIIHHLKHNIFECVPCENQIDPDRIKIEIAWPDGVHPENLPTHIALPVESFLRESHPRAKLHWLVDAAELIVRWFVAVKVSAIADANGDKLPKKLTCPISLLIERPTLGAWVEILRILFNNKTKAAEIWLPFFQVASEEIIPRFKPEKDKHFIDKSKGFPVGRQNQKPPSILTLRNNLAHGSGLTLAAAESSLAFHEESFLSLIKAVSGVCAEVTVIARWNAQVARLQGTIPEPLSPDECFFDPGTWLVHKTGQSRICLRPLMAYRPVSDRDELQSTDAVQTPFPQVYFRLEPERLSYHPLGCDETIAFDQDCEPFVRFFELDRKKFQSPIQQDFNWADFICEARLRSEEMVGRENELTYAKQWLKEEADPHSIDVPRIGWIDGRPGLGKSLLMDRLVTDASNGRDEFRQIYYHAFRERDPRNNRRSFLRGLQGLLLSWKRINDHMFPPESSDQDGKALEENLLRLIKPLAKDSSFCLTVYLDGLDEVVSKDSDFPSLIIRLALPGTLWLLAGRPDYGLNRTFERLGCRKLFQKGLPDMSPLDIRKMLIGGLGSKRYQLLRMDRDEVTMSQDQGVYNPFVERVVERASGLPIYVHLLLADLVSGRRKIRLSETLPDNLSSYYRNVTLSSGMSNDLGIYLSLIVCQLACAVEPIGRAALVELLQLRQTLADPERIASLVPRACDRGESLLSTVRMPDGNDGLSLYHQSFREYILGSSTESSAPELEVTLSEAKWLLCHATKRLDSIKNPGLRSHLLRRGCFYLQSWEGEIGIQLSLKFLKNSTYLFQMRDAWGIDSEGFLHALDMLYQKLYEKFGKADAKLVCLAFFDVFLKSQKSSLPLRIEPVHAILVYLRNHIFYAHFLELAEDPEISETLRSSRQHILLISLRARRANMLRRAGELSRAMLLLKQNHDQLLAGDFLGDSLQYRELSRIVYDIAYVHYLGGNFESAIKQMEKSIYLAQSAGHEAGEWMSRCVHSRFSMYAHLNDPVKFREYVLVFARLLKSAEYRFKSFYEETLDPNAERWVKNVHSHQFECAFLLKDKDSCRDRLNTLHQDNWIKRFQRKEILTKAEARYAMLTGKYHLAVELFKSLLTITDDPDHPSLKQEGIAQEYYDMGCSFKLAGNYEGAVKAWKTGLIANKNFANRHWYPKLQYELKKT